MYLENGNHIWLSDFVVLLPDKRQECIRITKAIICKEKLVSGDMLVIGFVAVESALDDTLGDRLRIEFDSTSRCLTHLVACSALCEAWKLSRFRSEPDLRKSR